MVGVVYSFTGGEKINDLLKRAKSIGRDPDWAKFVGETVVESIKSSTAEGKDIYGKEMQQYSTKPISMYTTKSAQKAAGVEKIYEPAARDGSKAKTRHFPGGYRQYKSETHGSPTVNLRNTGKMMDALIWKKRRDGVEIIVRLPLESRIGSYLQQKRKWFGLTIKAREAVIAFTRKVLGLGKGF